MYYLKLFQNHSQYNEFAGGGGMLKPNVSHCVQENEVHYNPHTWADEYFTIESLEDDNTIYLKASNTAITKTVSASTDNGSTWIEYTSSTGGSGIALATLNAGDKLLVKGENSTYAASTSNYNQFKTTGQFELKGNIMSLISGDSFANVDELTATYTFSRLLYQCTGLTSADNLVLPATTLTEDCYKYMFDLCERLTTTPELPATTLASNCYHYMFSNCTSLTTAPELPATTLADSCYNTMFRGCTNLTTAPKLPATTLNAYCYSHMFEGCTSLTTAPELSATTLASDCYSYMFTNCKSLTTAPGLPATKLTSYCYQYMFKGCTSLTTAPELPATTLAGSCYYDMFYGCTSLTTAPELPATTLASKCYYEMFSYCTNLNYIKAMFTTTPSGSLPNNYTQNWVNGVASSGTFVKNAAATWDVTGVHGIPEGWTVEIATT